VDVGAYNGYYALTLAKLTGAPVVSYEPDSEAMARCRRNLALNPALAPLVELRAVSVGAHSAEGSVTIDDELLPRARRTPSSCWLLKLDVEGAELEVLQGAQQFLELMRPHLIVETHSAELEEACGQTLRAAGYSPRVVTQRRVLRQDRSWPPGIPSHNRWLVAVGRERLARSA
jgi:hypothetical protein